MKRTLLCLFLVFLLFLTGCAVDPASYLFDAEELTRNTVKIELVDCKNDNPIVIRVGEEGIPEFHYDEATSLETLAPELMGEFIEGLSTVTFHRLEWSVNAPLGTTLVLHQSNGDMIVLSCAVIGRKGYSMVARFDSDCNFVEHIAEFADVRKFNALLDQYFHQEQ